MGKYSVQYFSVLDRAVKGGAMIIIISIFGCVLGISNSAILHTPKTGCFLGTAPINLFFSSVPSPVLLPAYHIITMSHPLSKSFDNLTVGFPGCLPFNRQLIF